MIPIGASPPSLRGGIVECGSISDGAGFEFFGAVRNPASGGRLAGGEICVRRRHLSTFHADFTRELEELIAQMLHRLRRLGKSWPDIVTLRRIEQPMQIGRIDPFSHLAIRAGVSEGWLRVVWLPPAACFE
jgi:hypothetical protein